MDLIDPELLAFYREKYGNEITVEDVLRMQEQLTEFFKLLIHFDKDQKEKSNENKNNGSSNNSSTT